MSFTYFSSLSGMVAASYGLQNTSNNIANMNSTGFKRNDVFYSSLSNGNGNGEEGLGAGVCIAGNITNFSEGKYLNTASPADLAIIGQGFFVVRMKTGELLYTRAGEFGFNNQGILIDNHSGGIVQGYDKSGNLVPIHEKGPKNIPGQASQTIFLKGQFIRIEKSENDKNQPGNFKNKYQNIKCAVNKIYDAQGKEHSVQLEFESTPVLVNGDTTNIPDDGKSWDLKELTCDGVRIDCGLDQKIIFAGTDTGANAQNNIIRFKLNGDQEVTFNFGDYREGADHCIQLKDTKLNPEGTKIDILQNDGFAEGQQTSFSFDENGLITYHYDNGKTIAGIHVGLARFESLEHNLAPTHDNLFRSKSSEGLHLGHANSNGFGSIQAKQLESSNVDPTKEFANIVVLQRMFQACSQIMDIDKQLLEGLETK